MRFASLLLVLAFSISDIAVGQQLSELPKPTSQSDGDKIENAVLVLHAPIVQPFKKNQYSFYLENRGRVAARDIKLEIKVPVPAKITGVIPVEAVITEQVVAISWPTLMASEKLPIHLTVATEDELNSKFMTRLTYSSDQT